MPRPVIRRRRDRRVPRTVAIIPARDESRTIRDVVLRTQPFVDAVIVVDDSSSDKTSAIAVRAGATVITSERRGYGNAILAGLGLAERQGFSVFATLDADGAHDPADLAPLLRRHARQRLDVTVGNRFSRRAVVTAIPSQKIAANRFATLVVNRVLGTALPDVACGLRILSARAANTLIQNKRSLGFALTYELLEIVSIKKLAIGTATVSAHYDATELFCTQTNELLDLMRFCRLRAVGQMGRFVADLQRMVLQRQLVALSFDSERFVLHPVKNGAAYVFQIQDPRFDSGRVARLTCP